MNNDYYGMNKITSISDALKCKTFDRVFKGFQLGKVSKSYQGKAYCIDNKIIIENQDGTIQILN